MQYFFCTLFCSITFFLNRIDKRQGSWYLSWPSKLLSTAKLTIRKINHLHIFSISLSCTFNIIFHDSFDCIYRPAFWLELGKWLSITLLIHWLYIGIRTTPVFFLLTFSYVLTTMVPWNQKKVARKFKSYNTLYG